MADLKVLGEDLTGKMRESLMDMAGETERGASEGDQGLIAVALVGKGLPRGMAEMETTNLEGLHQTEVENSKRDLKLGWVRLDMEVGLRLIIQICNRWGYREGLSRWQGVSQ